MQETNSAPKTCCAVCLMPSLETASICRSGMELCHLAARLHLLALLRMRSRSVTGDIPTSSLTSLYEQSPLAHAKCRFNAYADNVRLFLQQHVSVSLMQLAYRQPSLTISSDRPSLVTAHNAEAWGTRILRPAPLADQCHAGVLRTDTCSAYSGPT